jgi:hypothetical protein
MTWTRTSAYSGASGEWAISGHESWSVPFPFALHYRGRVICAYPCKDSAKAAAMLLDGAAQAWQ